MRYIAENNARRHVIGEIPLPATSRTIQDVVKSAYPALVKTGELRPHGMVLKWLEASFRIDGVGPMENVVRCEKNGRMVHYQNYFHSRLLLRVAAMRWMEGWQN
jgi:hypothetical protein